MAELIGYLLASSAIFTWALASLVYKSGLGRTDPKANLFFRMCCVSLGTFLFSLLLGNYQLFSTLTSDELVGYLIACAISGLSVTVGDLMYFNSLKKIDASRAFPLTQLSLVFVYPMAWIFFGELITLPIIIGGSLILSSVFLLSSKNKVEDGDSEMLINQGKASEDLLVGVILAIGTALSCAISIISFHQARIMTGDVFVTNFMRIVIPTMCLAILGVFRREYYGAFKKDERENLKWYFFIGITGSISLGLADSLFFKAAEINGLVLTSTITANTPMIQQLFAVAILKEKFRKKFLIAVDLIIIGNYIILFS